TRCRTHSSAVKLPDRAAEVCVAPVAQSGLGTRMDRRDDLEAEARALATALLQQHVAASERVDFRAGTYLLAALAAEVGQIVQRRCGELARSGDGRWELAFAESESVINGAWRAMEMIARLSDDFEPPRRRDEPA